MGERERVRVELSVRVLWLHKVDISKYSSGQGRTGASATILHVLEQHVNVQMSSSGYKRILESATAKR